MRIPRNLSAAALLATSVAALGVWPHLHFSQAVGTLTFFKGAYDEDTYVLWWWHGLAAVHRTLSTQVFNLLAALGGGNPDAVLVAADAVLPALAALAAFALAREIVASVPLRLMLALLLLFAQDLLSLGNVAVWSGGAYQFERFRGLFGAWGPLIVPDYATSYLALFRTPEPQLGYILFFAALALTVRLAREPQAPVWVLPALCLVVIVTSLTYVFLSLPVMLLALGFAVVLLASGQARSALALGGAVLAACLSFGLGLALQARGAGHLVFASRLPVVTPATAAGVVVAPLFLGWLLLRARGAPLAWLALGLLAMPAMLGNQQLVTGIMVSARDWERNANYPLVVAGLALAATLVVPRLRLPQAAVAAGVPLLVMGLFALWLVEAQQRSYGYWLEENALAVAMARAVAQAQAATGSDTMVALAEPRLAPHLRVRTRDRHPMLLDYTWLFERPVPPLDPAGGQIAPSPYEPALFEHWRRAGTSPEEVDQTLTAEARQKTGFFLGFLFSLQDYWYPATDNRNVRQREILALIPQAVARYRAYRAAPSGDLARREVIYLTRLVPDAVRPVPGLRMTPLGSAEVLGRRVFAYRQAPEP